MTEPKTTTGKPILDALIAASESFATNGNATPEVARKPTQAAIDRYIARKLQFALDNPNYCPGQWEVSNGS